MNEKAKVTEPKEWWKKLHFHSDSRAVPFVSGSASLLLLRDVIFSNKTGTDFQFAICGVLFVFLFSILLFGYLSKLEKEKDCSILEMVGRITDNVFKEYGSRMAENDAKAASENMNPIMQTIVELVKALRELAEKGYKT